MLGGVVVTVTENPSLRVKPILQTRHQKILQTIPIYLFTVIYCTARSSYSQSFQDSLLAFNVTKSTHNLCHLHVQSNDNMTVQCTRMVGWRLALLYTCGSSFQACLAVMATAVVM